MRERIVNEIRRLAEANESRAPSIRQFRNATRITDGTWLGKYWPKWSDAVHEAGLTTNQMQLGSDLSNEELLGFFAEACLHFRKTPSQAELRMYGNSRDGIFPNERTFSRRFGGKEQLIIALSRHATETGNVELTSVLPETSSSEKNQGIAATESVSEGWVYLLKSGDFFKIGRSDELEKRIKQISVALPNKVELVHAIRTDDAAGIEGYWHRRFADRRANGEWFKLTAADVRVFKRRKFQ